MKIYAILTCSFFTLLFASALAQSKEKEVNTEIKAVTVFLNGAQITRSGKVDLVNGTNEIVLTGLSRKIDANSIQVKGNNDFTIVSVKHRMNYLTESEMPEIVKVLKDSLKIAGKARKINLSKQKVLIEERNTIYANKNVGGSKTGVNVEAVMDLVDFYDIRLKEIELSLLNLKKSLREIKKKENQIRKQYDIERKGAEQPTSEIVVNISATGKIKSEITANYMIYGAGWIPYYDIRSNEVNGPIEIISKANVYQNSGNDWNKVHLTLSTGNPSLNNDKPSMDLWVLNNNTCKKQR